MKRTYIFLALITSFFMLNATDHLQNKDAAKSQETKWSVKIIEATIVDSINCYGGQGIIIPHEGHNLLIVGLNVSPPAKDENSVQYDSIFVLYNSSENFNIMGVDCQRDIPIDGYKYYRFVLMKDAEKPQEMVKNMSFMNKDKWLYLFKDGVAGGIAFTEDNGMAVAIIESKFFFRENTTAIYFMFEVPVTTKDLHLQFGEYLTLPITSISGGK